MSSDILVPAGGAQPTVSVGVMLSNERVKRGISLQEVADQLKLSRKQIEALENDDFDRLPGVAFVRGFTRNYAKFLGLDPIPLMLALDVVLPARTPPIIASAEPAPASDKDLSPPAPNKKSPAALMIGVAVLGVIGLLGVYASTKHEPSASSPLSAGPSQSKLDTTVAPVVAKTVPAAVAPVESSPVVKPDVAAVAPVTEVKPAATASTQADGAAPLLATPAATASPPATLAANQAVPSIKPVGMVGQMAENEIHLKVTQNSWLSVVDSSGKKLLYGEIAPGEERKLSGQPPFKLTIGNASGVSLLYKGQPVDLGPSTKGATARLVLK